MPHAKNIRLLSKEDREEHDTFDKSSKNDRKGQNITSSAWVTAGSFSSFGTEDTDANSGSKSSKSNVQVAGNSGECSDVHISYVCLGLSIPHSQCHGPNGKGLLVGVFFFVMVISMITNQLKKHGSKKHEYERLNKSNKQLQKVEWNRRQPCEIFAHSLFSGHEHHIF